MKKQSARKTVNKKKPGKKKTGNNSKVREDGIERVHGQGPSI